MSLKSVVTVRLEKARLLADSVKSVYEDAYNKVAEVRKGGVGELIKEIQPKIRAAVEGRLHDAQVVLDEFNQSLADKAIPSFRKSAVSRGKLDQKARSAQVAKNEAKPMVNVKNNTSTKPSGSKHAAPKKVAKKTKVSL